MYSEISCPRNYSVLAFEVNSAPIFADILQYVPGRYLHRVFASDEFGTYSPTLSLRSPLPLLMRHPFLFFTPYLVYVDWTCSDRPQGRGENPRDDHRPPGA